MEKIVIENEGKGLCLELEVSKNKVMKATVTYAEPVPLSEFINCSAIMRDSKPGGCGSAMVPPKAVVKTVNGRRV